VFFFFFYDFYFKNNKLHNCNMAKLRNNLYKIYILMENIHGKWINIQFSGILNLVSDMIGNSFLESVLVA